MCVANFYIRPSWGRVYLDIEFILDEKLVTYETHPMPNHELFVLGFITDTLDGQLITYKPKKQYGTFVIPGKAPTFEHLLKETLHYEKSKSYPDKPVR